MVRQLCILFLLLLSLNNFSQTVESKKPRIINKYKFGHTYPQKDSYEIKIDSVGVIIESKFFDSAGRLITQINYCENHYSNCLIDTAHFRTIVAYKYDNEGLLIENDTRVEYIDKPISVTIYTYLKNSKNQISKRLSVTTSSDDTLRSYQIEKEEKSYQYNNNGQLVKTRTFVIPDSKHWKRTITEKFKYDQRDTCISYDCVSMFKGKNYKRKRVDRSRKVFDEKGKLIEKTISLQPDYWPKYKYSYNDKNQISKEYFFEQKENKSILSLENAYNDNGDIIETIEHIVHGKGIVRILRWTYIYY